MLVRDTYYLPTSTYLPITHGWWESRFVDLIYANGGTFLGENHLSFIETSALDASNVELAFQNILTGKHQLAKPKCAHVY